MPNVVYIMGTARSGTTMLPLMLAATPGVFAAGEITHLGRDAFRLGMRCSCGAPAPKCPVWGEVASRLGNGIQRDDSHAEQHWGFLRMWSGRLPPGYAAHHEQLLRTVADVTGDNVVVDSSKYPGRALALMRTLPPGRLRIVSMTRSPAGLLTSFTRDNKQGHKTAPESVRYYLAVSSMLRLTKARIPDLLEITYEDLCDDPVSTLRRVGDFSGIDVGPALERLASRQPFDVGHVVTGNRLKDKGRLAFEPDIPPFLRPSQRRSRWVMERWGRALGFVG